MSTTAPGANVLAQIARGQSTGSNELTRPESRHPPRQPDSVCINAVDCAASWIYLLCLDSGDREGKDAEHGTDR
ncbi:hypothetical protein AJ78_08852 [Emergomyces pasteurianus Ep9510]|uniref:Uncharacterized protein n=1 Tax=Emergomyces pasteurianus Ep9510 TaxID=1447872 RepID=A0A1J9P0Q6_9EURO|nr:hypothetical protein AJ78_08852 [Emergomyces pasteurianus Ep9510]